MVKHFTRQQCTPSGTKKWGVYEDAPITTPVDLENKFRRHLELAGASRSIRTPELTKYLTEISIQNLITDTCRVITRVIEVCMVEDVVDLQPQLNARAFPNLHP